MSDVRRLRKRLTANDVGMTGSHQAGFHVPKSIATFFPKLDPGILNPDTWLIIQTAGGDVAHWRFIHYNNGVVADGTRDEFRVTHVREFLQSQSAKPGDVLEIIASEEDSYRAAVLRKGNEGDVLILETSGPWALIAYRRPLHGK